MVVGPKENERTKASAQRSCEVQKFKVSRTPALCPVVPLGEICTHFIVQRKGSLFCVNSRVLQDRESFCVGVREDAAHSAGDVCREGNCSRP